MTTRHLLVRRMYMQLPRAEVHRQMAAAVQQQKKMLQVEMSGDCFWQQRVLEFASTNKGRKR